MKSDASDLIELALCIYEDACAKCTADVSDLRDMKTLVSRVENEGLSFLTITLPSFSRALEQGLADGFIGPCSFPGFRKVGCVPAFLRGFIGQVFDLETGRIYDEIFNPPSSDSSVIVGCIRQICLAFKKIELDCTPQRVASALEGFIATERSFQMFELPIEERAHFVHVSSVLWDNMLGDLRLDMCTPRHGPGSTADGISGNSKFQLRYWYDRLEPYFPVIDNGYSVSAVGSWELDKLTMVPFDQELPVKVTPVPKTLKGPRIIAIEPVCMQYAQQGIRDRLYAIIESHWMTSGRVNFTDQSINQSLAMIGSMTGRLATIDLSDASDRVPRSLALEMFRGNRDLCDAIDACRSTHAKMPDGSVYGPLSKFASMGSALCFPVEAMYFYTICVGSLLKQLELPVTYANCLMVGRMVHVYGDDIIVPSAYAVGVLDSLQKYNCKVNTAKTFFTGRFRESCGVDAYLGEEVTPTYVGTLRPKNRRQASECISWVSTANLFYKRGYWRTSSLMFKYVERVLGRLPYLPEDAPGLGRYSFLGYSSATRWNEKYQRLEVRAWVPSPVFREDPLEGYAALQKCLMKLEGVNPSSLLGVSGLPASYDSHLKQVVSEDTRHLERSALHGAVTLKLRWVPSH
jgi:hypothetical protein